MKNLWEKILAMIADHVIKILISLLFGIISGNLATVYGPGRLSWGTVPKFLKDRVIREHIVTQRLNERLDSIFLHADSFYKSREYELTFVGIENGKIIQRRKSTTQVYNPFNEKREFNTTLFMSAGSIVKGILAKDSSGNEILHKNERDIALYKINDKMPISFKIDQNDIVTLSVEIETRVDLHYQESFVTNKLILGDYKMKVVVAKSLEKKLRLDFNSLSYEPRPDLEKIEGNRIAKLTGPIFPGGGLEIEWQYGD